MKFRVRIEEYADEDLDEKPDSLVEFCGNCFTHTLVRALDAICSDSPDLLLAMLVKHADDTGDYWPGHQESLAMFNQAAEQIIDGWNEFHARNGEKEQEDDNASS